MKKSGKHRDSTGHDALPLSLAPNAHPVLTVDYERYAHLLDDPELSEEQKRELLQALWEIICTFVSIGFGVHPAQQAQNTCGQLQGSASKGPDTNSNEVQSGSNSTSVVFKELAQQLVPKEDENNEEERT